MIYVSLSKLGATCMETRNPNLHLPVPELVKSVALLWSCLCCCPSVLWQPDALGCSPLCAGSSSQVLFPSLCPATAISAPQAGAQGNGSSRAGNVASREV